MFPTFNRNDRFIEWRFWQIVNRLRESARSGDREYLFLDADAWHLIEREVKPINRQRFAAGDIGWVDLVGR
jgi:hypothetical protein